jgi:outer membrane protein assembly factor BamD
MRYTVNALAQYEVHVARYYYNRGAYLAAISRAQQALTDYRDAPALEEALYILTLSYDKLGMDDLRDDAQRVLTQNYPDSDFPAHGFQRKDTSWWQLW